ncbi:MAG: ATP phosphoribosyltransferase [Candidatus Syntrophonatronum acetioxidans]|uniref:ATP phosphoribosyltransferase n=1 Tax=Candidatus Syntrophonatronum acetioxidans TaxID=1795816 RepID=A0A424YA74_9FIRM|nr:MAG: ATP phosphoribosyltransferase [Candidatus Syntrophonatronum acetioxidans]
MKKLKLGLPAGSLQKTTIEMFKKAGFNINVGDRSYFPSIDDEEIECTLIRAQEIPKYVQEGVLDVGLTGKDWIVETKSEVVEASELVYSKQGMKPIKLVLAVPNDSPVKDVKDLEGKKIATELVEATRDYLKSHNVDARVEFSWGATEVKPPKLADAIAELTETGRSLRANNLRILDVIMESTTRVAVNKDSWEVPWKRKKIENMITLLKGALLAEEKVGLKMNVSKENLEKVLNLLPALRNPTISHLHESDWVAIETVIDEKKVRELVHKLKEAGAEGIIEYSLNKIIP